MQRRVLGLVNQSHPAAEFLDNVVLEVVWLSMEWRYVGRNGGQVFNWPVEPSGVPANSVVAGGRNESNSPNGLPNNPGTRTTVTARNASAVVSRTGPT